MKLQIDRKTFAQALSEVAPFAPAKPTIPILKFAKITTKGNRLKIEANDTQCAMVKYIETLECDQDGSSLVEIAALNKFIAKTKGETINIEVDDNTVRVKHSNGTVEFQSIDAAEYPVFSMPKNEITEISIDTDILASAVNKCRGFVSTETLRPQMCAIYAYIKDSELGYCATDTHKLIHVYYQNDAPAGTDIHWYIMPSVFSAILSACKTAQTAQIQITDSHVSYRIGSTLIQSVQTKGKFPDFKRVIPSEWTMECAVDKSDLMDALGRVSMFCDHSECVKLNITPMDMTISVDNLDEMKKSCEQLTHNGCSGEIAIGVNVFFAQTSAGVFNSGDILLRMTDASRPILFNQRDNENVQIICMPMQIQSY